MGKAIGLSEKAQSLQTYFNALQVKDPLKTAMLVRIGDLDKIAESQKKYPKRKLKL